MLSANQTSVTGNGTVYTVPFDTEDFDIGSNYNSSTYTVEHPGVYDIQTQVMLGAITAVADGALLEVFVSGSVLVEDRYGFDNNLPTTELTLKANCKLLLAVGDTLSVRVTIDGEAADTVTVFGNGNIRRSFLSMIRVD